MNTLELSLAVACVMRHGFCELKSIDFTIGAPIEDKSPVAGSTAPIRRVSLTPPPLRDPVDVALGWQATIQIVDTTASKARQSVEKNLLVMVTMDYDHIYEVAVIVSAKSHDIYH